MQERAPTTPIVTLGIGFYTAVEAARLLKLPTRNINRWLGGYDYKQNGVARRSPPLWTPELPESDGHIELSFRDLMELRFVQAFAAAGLSLVTIRKCLERARQVMNDDRPLTTRRFRTDGRTIFFDTLRGADESDLIDLKKNQYVMKRVIEQSFRDLDIEGDAVVRWRPYKGRDTIVVDPARAFGQPLLSNFGVPTVVLADAARAERSVQRAARLFEVPVAQVREAVAFEESLLAA